MRTILVVDDNIINLKAAERTLAPYYDTIIMTSGRQALEYLAQHTPDLILLDISMPKMDGYETLKALREIPEAAEIPVIFLTANSDAESEVKGLEMGAVDFIFKPFVPQSMLQRIRKQMELFDYRKDLKRLVQEKTRQIELVQDAVVISLTELVECRDGMTGGHSRRVAQYTGLLLDYLYQKGKFPEILNEDYVQEVKRGAVLHDIGKVGIADMALLKDSRLTDQEMEYMRQHTMYGGMALDRALEKIGNESFLRHARDMAYYHHEKWNGRGYPFGLSGTDIPLSARILAVADVYDALTSRRRYKEPFSHEKAVEIILGDRGTAFDPEIVDLFDEIQDKFKCLLSDMRNTTEAFPQNKGGV